MYKYTDKILASLDRQFLRIFRKLRLMKFDELNVLNHVVAAYRRSDKLAKKGYLDIAIHAYLFALAQAEEEGYKPKQQTEIDEDWILEMLEEEDFVTLYDYENEWERKRQRLSEALAATNAPNKEIDKALKLAILQVSHYADKATAKAAIQAFKDAGVKKVKWITERDDRVCAKCEPLDGKVFDIDKIPPIPQHWRCRCRVIPVEK